VDGSTAGARSLRPLSHPTRLVHIGSHNDLNGEAHPPAVHVRRPRIDYESHAAGLDRNEVGALLVAAGLGAPSKHAFVSLLSLNGLHGSEATGADNDRLGDERGHRTLTILRKGGKIVTIR
jgi:integrase/recombinase XerD